MHDIYYLPGRNGRLEAGLGEALLSKGLNVSGRELLLSPIVGEFVNSESQTFFVPPRARQLMELVQAGQYHSTKQCNIHVGELDWQSNPDNVQALATHMKWEVTVVPQAGHMLPKAYVGALLDRWIS